MISKKMGYDLNGEGFTREDAKACTNLLSTPNVKCEGFDNVVTITPAEKVLSVIFSLKYMPNASHGDSLVQLLNEVKNKAIK